MFAACLPRVLAFLFDVSKRHPFLLSFPPITRALAVIMAPLFRKTLSQPSMSSHQNDVLLVPVDNTSLSRHSSGFGGPMQDIEGLVYTTEGIFSQIIPDSARQSTPTIQEANNQPAIHIPLGDEDDDEDDPDAEKKQAQWLRWTREVIPAMVQPYLSLLRGSGNLSNLANVRSDVGCSGCEVGRWLTVSCIYFERKPFIIILWYLLSYVHRH